MTTTTNKERPVAKPSKTDSKKAPNMLSAAERKKSLDAGPALAKKHGFKEGRLDGAIIWFSEGTLF